MIIGSVNPFPVFATRWFSVMTGEIARSLRAPLPEAPPAAAPLPPAAPAPRPLLAPQRLSDIQTALETESGMLRRLDQAANVVENHLTRAGEQLAELRQWLWSRLESSPPADAGAGQPQIDTALARIDLLGEQATLDGRPLLQGNATLAAGRYSVNLEALHTRELGRTALDEQIFHLADLASGGPLADRPTRGLRVVDAADTTVRRMQLRLTDFRQQAVLSRLDEIDSGLLHLASSQLALRTADHALELAHLIRTSTLDPDTLASITHPPSRPPVDLLA